MKKLVLVDTISQHRMRYVVEVEDDVDHALDEFIVREDDPEFKEFSQLHLGSTIVSHRVISESEYFDLFDEDNEYLQSWEDKNKLSYINKIDYSE
jgi:hypothetical protein